MQLNLPKTLPLLPGLRFEDHSSENHHQTQQFSLVNNTIREKTNFVKEDLDPNLIDSLRMKTPLNLTYGSRKKVENDYIPRIQPPWLKYDRQVLRFRAYFQESVVENPNENYRVRRCTIYFYLSDDTIHVNEPKVQNSGLPQGVFIKRQKIAQKLGSATQYHSWKDITIPMSINFFQRVFRIYDCDDFTREFYDYMGYNLGTPEEVPTDSFLEIASRKDLKIPPPDTKEYKEYIEVRLGVGHPNGGLQKYLENDRKVLSFSIIWQDNTLEGGTNFFTLNFFLADDTVEVKEIRKHNSGKDPFPLLLNRSKVPKVPILTHYPGMTLKKEEFYSPSDLLIGNYVRVFSQDCLIFDCDEFTRRWYQENMAIEMRPIEIQQEKPRQFVHPVPPYNGYGTAEDSLGSVYNLQPQPPKKDIPQMYTQDQYILRFEARMVSKSKDDNVRQFIISFFCGDDTVMVYENAERNSGIWKGKFLERNQLVNPETKDYFQDKDFQVGQTIQVSVWTFQLLRPDEFTFNYMKDRPNVYPDADISNVLAQIKEIAQTQFKSLNEFLIDFLKQADQQGKGYIGYIELALGLQEIGFNLSYQAIYTIMKYFDPNNNWKISMRHLFDGLGGGYI